tara:strand:- start:1572 stop:1874 length:303 start_codon:yes stop_codon:yes gene_type:complete
MFLIMSLDISNGGSDKLVFIEVNISVFHLNLSNCQVPKETKIIIAIELYIKEENSFLLLIFYLLLLLEINNNNALNGLSISNESINITGDQIVICTHKSG